MKLSELRNAMQRYSTAFDAALISAWDAARVVEDAAAIKNIATTIEALAAARVAGTKAWKREGDRSPAHQFARATGVSVSQAQETLASARRLAELPAVEAAAKRGELSASQVAVITDAAQDDPDAAARLVAQAQRVSLGELRNEAARTKATAIDLEARRRRIHGQRGVRTYTDASGVGNLHWRDNPERIAEYMALLDPCRDRLFKRARKEGRREPLEAYAADAMVAMARGAENGTDAKPGRTTKILVRVDLPTLLRGHPVDDETCEIVGYGPVAVSVLRDMMDTGDPFLAAIVTKGKQVLGIAHLGRQFTSHQRSALEWLYPTCTVEGCNALAYLEYDHREDWAKTHRTILDLADRPCSHHHDLKSREGWGFVEGTGKRAFVPPDDPRHPKHAERAHAPPHAA